MLRFFRRGHQQDRQKTQAAGPVVQSRYGAIPEEQDRRDELEELLISADVEISTTMKLLDALRDRIRRTVRTRRSRP